jgi:adenosylmethionine-8-amino-7-oxononanoate aminotransferase
VGAYLLERLRELEVYDFVDDVRGIGLMTAFEFVRDKATREPFAPSLRVSYRFSEETLKRGLILWPVAGSLDGVAGDMLMVTPPLIVSREQVDTMIDIMKASLDALAGQLRP